MENFPTCMLLFWPVCLLIFGFCLTSRLKSRNLLIVLHKIALLESKWFPLYVYSDLYVYCFGENIPPVCLLPPVRLFRTLEYLRVFVPFYITKIELYLKKRVAFIKMMPQWYVMRSGWGLSSLFSCAWQRLDNNVPLRLECLVTQSI